MAAPEDRLDDGRGILFPAKLPSLHREPPPEALIGLVRWFWIPRWDVAPGRTSRQQLLPFPASNLVVQADGVSLAGPTTRAGHRDLTGVGWAVGALLRPAATASLRPDPGALRDRETTIEAPDLYRTVVAAMGDDEAAGNRLATAEFAAWAVEHLSVPDEGGLLANAMEDLIATDRTVVRVEQIARHLSLSTRAVQRLAERYVGLPPLAIIRRYRLQEAALRVRDDPSVTIAAVAAELGYADHAHLTADFRSMLGFTPSAYRRDPDHLG